MNISNSIRYIGVNDHSIDLFEGQYRVPHGMSYNSYAIIDEKIAVLDTIDIHFTDEWLGKLTSALGGRQPDYLVVHHMEPDHSASIKVFMDKYPDATVVSSAMAFNMMKNYFGTDFADRRLLIKEGSALALGAHTLNFIAAPMVHWPEVMMSYESSEKVLFSADGFGKFGALDATEEWDDEARRYYIGIVAKFGLNVQAVLKKAAALDIRMICPLHGPVLTGDLSHYIGLYDTWSGYKPESDGVTLAYTSVYGHTKEAVMYLASELRAKGCPAVQVFDLARDDMAEAVASAFRYSKVCLATTTYYGEIFPIMRDYIARLNEHSFQNRTVALIENGSWAPMAAKVMTKLLEEGRDLDMLAPVTLRGALIDTNKAQLSELAAKLA